VHTSVLAGGAYPSQIEVHNYASTAQTYVLSVYEATTGALKGRTSINTAANSTYLIPFVGGIQQAIGWTPTASEIHANVVLQTTTGTTAPQASIGHTIVNTRQTNTVLNMTNVCSVNAPPAVVVPATTPVAYCGTVTPAPLTPFPYNLMQYTLTASVATNGRIKGHLVGRYSTYGDFDSFTGTVTGSTFQVVTSGGIPLSGTIANGTLSGSAASIYGTIRYQATTAGCSS
ncbi:MAG: hypothetical protein LCH56_09655, partial [Proteobacteria bacterium]|nr:hypothetical protein [Pseudomonadota bacterium]